MSVGQEAVKATYFSILTNFVLALVKGVSGVLGHSYALIADALESTADIFSSFLVLLGLKFVNKPADRNHPYGHGRVEPLITFMVVAFLIGSAGLIGYESIQRIRTPHPLPKAWTLFVLAPIIIWKEISYRIVSKKGRETNSSSLKADAWHHRGDAILSVLAFVGISIAVIMGEGWESADDWAAFIGALVIFFNAFRIFRPALGELMDEQRYGDMIETIRTIAKTVEGIEGTEKCFIRKSGLEFHVELHAIVDGQMTVERGHHLAHQLVDTLKGKIPELGQVLVHIEPDRLTTQTTS